MNLLSGFRKLLKRLVTIRWFFLLLGLVAVAGVLFLLFSDNPKLDKYLLPGAMSVAWCFSLFAVLCGYFHLVLETPEQRLWARVLFRIKKAIIGLLEVGFLATSIILLWLSVRSIIFMLTH